MQRNSNWQYRALTYAMVAVTFIVLALPARANMIYITIAGTTLDLTITKTSTNEIMFSQANFPNYKGYEFSGVLVGYSDIIRLQDFTVTRPAGQNLMPLNIVFGGIIEMPKVTEVIAEDSIAGNFNNKLGMHILGKGNMLSFQGFIDGMPITPPKGAYTSAPAGGTRRPVPFGGGNGPLKVKGNGTYNLKAELSITLGVAGDRIAQAPIPPGPAFYASVSIVPAPANVPEPPGWSMLLIGLFGLIAQRNRALVARIFAVWSISGRCQAVSRETRLSWPTARRVV